MERIARVWIPPLLIILAVTARSSFSFPEPRPAELGTWWRDSDIARGLRLRDGQIRQIEQAFLEHRSELNTLAADLLRQESALQTLIDSSNLDEKKAAAQIDEVLSARIRLEKEKTMMALDIRRAVSYEQWKKLQELQREQASLATAPAPTAASAAAAARPAGSAGGSPPAAEEPVYQAGGPVLEPVPVQRPAPAFTPEARARKVEGTVLLGIVIGKDGAVRNVRVLRGLGYGLDESAVETVTRRWLFKPATLNGRPVAAQALIEVTFR